VKHRLLGRTGLKVSEICLGTMTFGVQCDEAESVAILDRAASQAVDFIDTADCYPVPMSLETAGRTEEILGRWLVGKRHDFVIATKCFFPMGEQPHERGNSRRHIFDAVEASLRRLRTDFIDLFQVHAFDPDTAIEETMGALDDVVRAGKARYVGCSNFLAWEVGKALLASERLGVGRFSCVQPRYSLIHRDIETDLLPLCRDEGLGVIVFNPLAGGLLTGKHSASGEPDPKGRFGAALKETAVTYRRRYWYPEAFEAVESLKAFFQPRARSLTTVSIAWVLAQPGITAAIVGASRPDQLDATLAASDTELGDEEFRALDEVWFRLPRQRPTAGPVR